MAAKLLLPEYDDLQKTILEALKALGGSGSNAEVDEAVIAPIGATQ
jgi:hypothetical protein